MQFVLEFVQHAELFACDDDDDDDVNDDDANNNDNNIPL